MLCWISMFGGLLIMMGHNSRSEALFSLKRAIGVFSRPAIGSPTSVSTRSCEMPVAAGCDATP